MIRSAVTTALAQCPGRRPNGTGASSTDAFVVIDVAVCFEGDDRSENNDAVAHA